MTFADLPAARVAEAADRTLKRWEEEARRHPTPRGPAIGRLRDLWAFAAAVQKDGQKCAMMSIDLEDFALLARSWAPADGETDS